MEGILKSGTKLKSDNGFDYKIIKLLGSGGQGEVYEVSCGKSKMALKWYYKNSATEEQKDIILHLIDKGKPDSAFLWPVVMVTKVVDNTF